jgi:hypothetical protein
VRIDEKKVGEKMNWAKVVFQLEKLDKISARAVRRPTGEAFETPQYMAEHRARSIMSATLAEAFVSGFSDDEAREYVQLHGDAEEALENVKI